MLNQMTQTLLKTEDVKLDLILQGIKDYAIFMLDKNGKIRSWNKAAEKIYKYREDEVLGSNTSIFYTESGVRARLPEKALRSAIEEGRHEEEGLRVKKDGSLFWADVIVTPLFNKKNQLEGFVKVVRDISERKQEEEQKDDFLGVVSHELKTPVTSVKAYAQALEKMFKQKGDEKSALLIDRMDKQLNKMTCLINDLLDVTKMRSGKLKFNEDYYNILDLIKETTDQMQLTTEKQLVKKLGKSKTVFGDKDRVAQVLMNFITNAIKYSPESDEVIISSRAESGKVEVCVRDFGLGIPKEKQQNIFRRFYRAGGQSRETFPGLGLGLYISNEIIMRQGGKIWFKSVEGEGSTFCFRLPIEKTNGEQTKIKW